MENLSTLPSSDRLFNPYQDGSPGASVRRDNLSRYLVDMISRRPRVLMLFEAPGYRGCALSGVPVTSERVMLRGVSRWGLFGEGYQPTSAKPHGVSEMTATILWGALETLADEPPLIWNAVPLHPHRPGERQSNRAPAAEERRMGLTYIQQVADLFRFDTILAVGRTAQNALAALSMPMIPLRHPSQGGKPEFLRGLRDIYRT